MAEQKSSKRCFESNYNEVEKGKKLHTTPDLMRVTLPQLALVRHGWIFLYACTFGALVYRSPLVKMESEMYKPAADLVQSQKFCLVFEHQIKDPSMMFGRAIIEAYAPKKGNQVD